MDNSRFVGTLRGGLNLWIVGLDKGALPEPQEHGEAIARDVFEKCNDRLTDAKTGLAVNILHDIAIFAAANVESVGFGRILFGFEPANDVDIDCRNDESGIGLDRIHVGNRAVANRRRKFDELLIGEFGKRRRLRDFGLSQRCCRS